MRHVQSFFGFMKQYIDSDTYEYVLEKPNFSYLRNIQICLPLIHCARSLSCYEWKKVKCLIFLQKSHIRNTWNYLQSHACLRINQPTITGPQTSMWTWHQTPPFQSHTHNYTSRLMFWCFHVLMTISSRRREATWFKPCGYKKHRHAQQERTRCHTATTLPLCHLHTHIEGGRKPPSY